MYMEYLPGDLPHKSPTMTSRTALVAVLVVVGVVAGAVVQQCRADAIDDEAICGGDSEAFKAAFQQVKFPDGIAASDYDGKVLLIVNVASKCGLTVSRYKDLNYLTSRFDAKSFAVVAFPCNQFGQQEPYPDNQILDVLDEEHGLAPQFPLMPKVSVNGDGAIPLYKALKADCELAMEGGRRMVAKPAGELAWNFEQFLVASDGKPFRRYHPGISPIQLESDISFLLNEHTEL